MKPCSRISSLGAESLLNKTHAQPTHCLRLLPLGSTHKHAFRGHSAHPSARHQPHSACPARLMLGNQNHQIGATLGMYTVRVNRPCASTRLASTLSRSCRDTERPNCTHPPLVRPALFLEAKNRVLLHAALHLGCAGPPQYLGLSRFVGLPFFSGTHRLHCPFLQLFVAQATTALRARFPVMADLEAGSDTAGALRALLANARVGHAR